MLNSQADKLVKIAGQKAPVDRQLTLLGALFLKLMHTDISIIKKAKIVLCLDEVYSLRNSVARRTEILSKTLFGG